MQCDNNARTRTREGFSGKSLMTGNLLLNYTRREKLASSHRVDDVHASLKNSSISPKQRLRETTQVHPYRRPAQRPA